ncbi:hypothetical protein THAOC_18971 [Thalassiosira oceanica]|uniref:Uncharacterized protein n=1 Tax=Thalassiosira oceanica TaxID=159749 RepID=K0SI12_THAOC|nr:hypothetical protein THAOC_18971 [Thalassiosira oceanica]|eukprot:EJK60636.1 hypothetical protein THAOC_18971 [Thalassiosira oceanica]
MTDASPACTLPPAGGKPHLDKSDGSKNSSHGVADSPRVVAADKEAGDAVSVMSQVSIDPPAGPTQSTYNTYGARGGSSVSSLRSLGDPPDKSGSIGSHRKKRGTNTLASIHNIEMNYRGRLQMEGDMSSIRNGRELHNNINRQNLEPLEENCELHGLWPATASIQSMSRLPIKNMFAAQARDKKTQYRELANKTFVRSSSSGSSRRKRGTMKFISKFASKYTSKKMLYIAMLSVLVMTGFFSAMNDIDDTNVVDMRSPTGGIMEDARQTENGRMTLMETQPNEHEDQSHSVEDIEQERRGGERIQRLDDAPPHLRGFYAKQMGINEPQLIVESVNPEIGGAATMQDISDPKPLQNVDTHGILSQLQYRQKPKTLQEKIQDGQDMLAAISLQVEEGQRDGQFGHNPLPPYYAKHVEVPSVDQQQAEVQNEQGPPPPVEQQQIQEHQQIMDGQAFEAQLQSQAFNGADQPVVNPEMLLPAGVAVNVDRQQRQQQQDPPEEVDQSQQQTIEASLEAVEADLAEFLPAPIDEGDNREQSREVDK